MTSLARKKEDVRYDPEARSRTMMSRWSGKMVRIGKTMLNEVFVGICSSNG